MIEYLTNHYFLENSLLEYLWFAGWLVAGLILKRFLPSVILSLSYKSFKQFFSETAIEDIHQVINKVYGNFVFIIFAYLAFRHIDFPDSWSLAPAHEFGLRQGLIFLYWLIFSISLTRVILRMADTTGLILTKKYEADGGKISTVQVIPFAVNFIKIIIIVFAVLVVLSALFKINVAAILAGLGIGGLAIALAAKDSFENLLGSFIIFFDKPFIVGEFIYINDIYCTVEKIGLRSSRFRTLERTYLTLPNKLVVENAIQNYTMRDMRRVDRIVQLSRKTTHSQIQNIIADLKTYIENNERTNSETIYVNFHEISPISLNIRLQYYVSINDWAVYLEVVEEVNLKTLEVIENHGAELAYPTTTVKMDK